MRLATVLTAAGPLPVAVRQDQFISLAAADNPARVAGVRQLLERGPDALRATAEYVSRATPLPADAAVRLLPPVPDPPKIICLGLNYRDHAAESGAPIPKEPVLFSKYATALVGHDADIVLPPVSDEVDYEAELVVVVGKTGRPKNADEAKSYLAGYTVGHDVSARDWQLKKDGKQWMVGKTFDTFAPVGPHLVTADEVPDPHNLAIKLRLNGQTMQDGHTSQMIFPVPDVLVYLAKVFTLQAGDLIFTGTPPGVGFARKPPVFLQPGDVTEVEIEGLGLLRNRCVRG